MEQPSWLEDLHSELDRLRLILERDNEALRKELAEANEMANSWCLQYTGAARELAAKERELEGQVLLFQDAVNDNESLRKELAATVSQRDEWQECHKSVSEELAEARAALESYANAGDGLVSLALEAANARIAELEGKH